MAENLLAHEIEHRYTIATRWLITRPLVEVGNYNLIGLN